MFKKKKVSTFRPTSQKSQVAKSKKLTALQGSEKNKLKGV